MRDPRTSRGLPFILPYLPFLILFGIGPVIYALNLAFTNADGSFAAFHNFVRTFEDYRFVSAFEHVFASIQSLQRSDFLATDRDPS